MIPASNRWGPFAAGLDQVERAARCRCLRAIAHLRLGPRGKVLVLELWRAERNDAALGPALAAIEALAPLDRRRVLASYAALSRPLA